MPDQLASTRGPDRLAAGGAGAGCGLSAAEWAGAELTGLGALVGALSVWMLDALAVGAGLPESPGVSVAVAAGAGGAATTAAEAAGGEACAAARGSATGRGDESLRCETVLGGATVSRGLTRGGVGSGGSGGGGVISCTATGAGG